MSRISLAAVSLTVSLTALSLLLLSGPGTAAPGDTERVSVSSTETESHGSDNEDSAISADGRFVAFASGANDLVPSDNNNSFDAFVRDRQLGTTERVSVDSSGVEGDWHSGEVDINADGRYVAFVSSANNLVTPNETDFDGDVFVHDRQTGDTEVVSVDSLGNLGEASSLGPPAISADGRYVAFGSTAENLVADDNNGVYDAFVHDRMTGITERVSVDSLGDEGDSDTFAANLSSDGRYVAFDTRSVLVPEDANGEVDVYVRDLQTDTIERISVDTNGDDSDNASFYPHLSSDGRFVVFESRATDLVPGTDTNGDTEDIYVHDRQTGTTERVSVDNNGDQGSGESRQTGISGDGRLVVFGTPSALDPDDGNGFEDVYVHDRQTDITTRISKDTAGNDGNEDSWGSESDGSISTDGRYVTFISDASDLVNGDFNTIRDVFVHDLGGPATPTPIDSPSPTLTPSPTATPTASATASPTGTPTESPTQSPTESPTTPPGAQRSWGDNNCSGEADPIDSLLALRFDAGLSTNTGDCPEMGEVVEVQNASPHPWGDTDCGGDVNPVDSLKLLRFDAGLDVAQADGCPEVGATVVVEDQG